MLTPQQILALRWSWAWWGRPNQQAPTDRAWTYWLISAGRGFGKTRTGAEWVRAEVSTHRYVNLIGATADDARDIMIEGESGILAVCPPWERPDYKPSQRKLIWPNGAQSLIFTADEPERLRGKQHEKLWADELGAWRYPESWDQAQFGLRLGATPQALITTTPRPTQVIRDLIANPDTVVTRGTTYDNQRNLAPSFFTAVIRKYEGTRLGRQELNAELLDDNPSALWTHALIDAARVKEAPADMRRVVIGVDPAVTSNEESAETGIIPVGAKWMGDTEHYFVLDDRTVSDKPSGWARATVSAYHDHKADRIVAEVNNGGDLVESVIRNVDRNVAYSSVHASRGKTKRAEPVAALYEQGRVHHVGVFAQLEDQMCSWDPTLPSDQQKSPDRMDALVWAITELSDVNETGIIDYYARELAERKARNG